MTPHRFLLEPLALAALLACQLPATLHAQTLPGTATVINGVVDVQRFTNGVQVTNTPGAILHWDRFSIGAGNTVRFVQQNAGSAVLNRVTGNTPSQIHGALQSNGRVFLLNPNGILFGAGARVDVAGLLASTLDIRDQDFLDGEYDFKCFNAIACEGGVDALNPYNNRVVLEDGSQITTRNAGEGGQVWLIARDRVVSEKGSSIEAPSGQVMAATAREVSISSPALGQMRFTLTGSAGSRIDLSGDIDVPRGAAGFFADSIRLNGKVQARSDVGAAGQIIASAASSLTLDGDARLDVSGNAGANAGAVRLAATQTLTVAPTSETAADGGLPTAGQAAPLGGLIELDAYQLNLPWAIGSNDPDGSGDFMSFSYRTGNGHMPLHAGAQGAASGNVQRHGIVRIQERGAFTVQQTDVNLQFQASYSNAFGQNPTFEQVIAVVPSVGPNLLLVAGQSDARGQAQIRLRVLSPTGQVSTVSSVAVGAGSVTTRALPLSQGGWLVLLGSDPSSVLPMAPRVVVVGADGAVVREIAIAGAVPGENTGLVFDRVWALQGGGFAITTEEGGGLQTRLYGANGALDVQASASRIAGEEASRARQPTAPYADKRNINFDARLQQRGVFSDDFRHVGEQLVDRVTGETRFAASHPPLAASPQAYAAADRMLAPGLWSAEQSTEDFNVRRYVLITPDGSVQAVLGTSQGYVTGPGAGTRESVDAIWTGSGSGLVLLGVSTERRDNGVTHFTDAQSMRLFNRVPVALPFSGTGTAGDVALPVLLASQAGQTNGALGNVGTPTFPPDTGTPTTPTPTIPTTPTTPPTTGLPSGPGDTSPPPTRLEIPPPPYQPPTLPAAGTPPRPGLSVIDVARLRTGDVRGPVRTTEVIEEAMDGARATIFETLGPEAVEAFNRGTDESRRKILDEARWVYFLDDKDLLAATRNMSRDMRGSTLNALSMLQSYGTLDSEALDQGLRKALTVKIAPPQPEDGSPPGTARTALETELNILESELLEANRMRLRADGQGDAARQAAELEHRRVTGRIARALVVAAREAAGEPANDSGDLEIANNGESRMMLTEQGELRSDPL